MNERRDMVLVVDDRPANRYAAVHTLTRAGFGVMEAATGKAALEMAIEIPAVILLDVKLPDILGYEVCRRLKANPRTSHIPVLQISAAFIDNESRVYALESGADAYLTQPVEPIVLLATVRSLIKLGKAEALATLSARQWQATFDALSEGVAVVDEDGTIARCNAALCGLLGCSYAEIEGDELARLLRESLGFEAPHAKGMQICEFTSGSRFLRMREEPVFVEGERDGSIFVLADITREKLAENSALLNERLAATGRMAHTIAHEINNPLEAITNLLYLLRTDGADSERAAEYLRSAEEEVARVARISRQILTFHRDSSTPVEVNIAEVLDDVLALNNRALVEKKLRVRREWVDGIRLRGFPAQLRQVFSNLYRNAMEASSEGGEIRLKISGCYLRGDMTQPAVRISMADYGVGIPKRNLERIFDAFFTTKELKGSGVGLWLSSSIVQEHGGRIQVRSSMRAGRSGTCVSVLMPCRREADASL